jgi:RNA polymerase sigma-70 factor (ECF subfamily)
MDLAGPGTSRSTLDDGLPREYWVQPMHDSAVLPVDGDPAELAAMRDSVRLAFVAALQYLPAKQRAVLILREVLKWQASEVAELLDTSVASVNSALQRARATMAENNLDQLPPTNVDDEQQELLAKYIAAFERYDVETLVSLLHDDAIQQMPPYQLWLRGAQEIGKWFLGQGIGCQGSRAIPVQANGLGGYAVYRPAGPERWEPFSIQLVEFSGPKVSALHAFLYPELFELFGLPDHLET